MSAPDTPDTHYGQKPDETREEHLERCFQEIHKRIPYLMINILIEIYTIDQNIGRRIHEAYRKAILATLDDAEILDESIAEIESTEAVLTASENQLQRDDELVKSFSDEVKHSAGPMVSLIQKDRKKGLRIHDVSSNVMGSTYQSTTRGQMPDAEETDLFNSFMGDF